MTSFADWEAGDMGRGTHCRSLLVASTRDDEDHENIEDAEEGVVGPCAATNALFGRRERDEATEEDKLAETGCCGAAAAGTAGGGGGGGGGDTLFVW